MNQLQAYNIGEDGDEVKYASSVPGELELPRCKIFQNI
jgi:hypothetical protein